MVDVNENDCCCKKLIKYKKAATDIQSQLGITLKRHTEAVTRLHNQLQTKNEEIAILKNEIADLKPKLLTAEQQNTVATEFLKSEIASLQLKLLNTKNTKHPIPSSPPDSPPIKKKNNKKQKIV